MSQAADVCIQKKPDRAEAYYCKAVALDHGDNGGADEAMMRCDERAKLLRKFLDLADKAGRKVCEAWYHRLAFLALLPTAATDVCKAPISYACIERAQILYKRGLAAVTVIAGQVMHKNNRRTTVKM